MADIINLRRARKGLERAHRQVAAAEARVRHGRTKAERNLTQTESLRVQKQHNSHALNVKGANSAPPQPPSDDGATDPNA